MITQIECSNDQLKDIFSYIKFQNCGIKKWDVKITC